MSTNHLHAPHAASGGSMLATVGRALRRALPAGRWRVDQVTDRFAPREGRARVSADGLVFDLDRADFLQRQIYVTGEYEPHLCARLRQHLKPGAVFYDIGANVGYLSLLAWKLGARVHAFEPNPNVRSQLERNIALNGADVRVFDVGLSDCEGSLPLYLDQNGNSGASSLAAGRSDRSVDIRLVTLDSLDLPPPDVIKIDIEGAEVRALRGARRALAHRPVILCEVSEWSLRQLGNSTDELFDLLSGYRAEVISPVRRSIADERRVYFQYDVLFVPESAPGSRAELDGGPQAPSPRAT